ncbi:G-type lectin S-receptor-like serine/threonine-protein kinase SD2-5 [Populus alba]|uniref:G-type lectin S-receptor-like serine/threonine-protein kinase SD2-5 n=1 Tax=Populus alba TaxID=43335 RepID=UPI003CC6FC82
MHNATPRRRSAPFVAGLVGGGLLIISKLWRKSKTSKEDVEVLAKTPIRFPYEDLRVATDDFAERIGRGGYGSVFKGVLADGTRVAVKCLDKLDKGSGDNWKPARKKIILDIAKGLAYLHEECRQTIIHFDIKPQNILLGPNFNAKISDFGLSKVIDEGTGQVQVSMRGTPGYIAPELCKLPPGRITEKIDIYSFGIVLLEIVCARKNVDHSLPESDFHLVRMLQNKAEEDRLIDIVENVDACMHGDKEEILRMIKIGAWCLQDDPERRPLMSTIVKILDGVMEIMAL